MGVTTLINDWKRQSTTFSISSTYITLGKRRDISISSLAESQASSSCVAPPPAARFKSLKSAFVLEAFFFFFFTRPGDGKLAPVSHSCSWVLMPLKVWHRAVIRDRSPGSGCGCSPAGFPMGNGNHCSIHCLVFAAFPHTKQVPHNRKQLWKKKKGKHLHSLISGEQVSWINTDFPCFKLCNLVQQRSHKLKKNCC